MSNLASIIREAERMRNRVQAVDGPHSTEDQEIEEPNAGSIPETASFAESLPSSNGASQAAPSSNGFADSPSVSPPFFHAGHVRLTEDQLEALRSALAPPPEVMTIGEAAYYLRVGRQSLLDFVREEGLPAVKLAGKWRFKRSTVDHWLERRLATEKHIRPRQPEL
jgi:excisionase family DNA binding protein